MSNNGLFGMLPAPTRMLARGAVEATKQFGGLFNNANAPVNQAAPIQQPVPNSLPSPTSMSAPAHSLFAPQPQAQPQAPVQPVQPEQPAQQSLFARAMNYLSGRQKPQNTDDRYTAVAAVRG